MLAIVCLCKNKIENDLEGSINGEEDAFKTPQKLKFNSSNLKNYEQLLQENKFKDWKEEFPKGAELLTYLFRILLWAESDL